MVDDLNATPTMIEPSEIVSNLYPGLRSAGLCNNVYEIGELSSRGCKWPSFSKSFAMEMISPVRPKIAHPISLGAAYLTRAISASTISLVEANCRSCITQQQTSCNSTGTG